MVRYFIVLLTFVSLLVLAIAGLRDYSFLPHKTKRPPIELFPDMVRQDKVKAQAPSAFFADGRGARSPIAGTVPMGYAEPSAALATSGVVMGGAYDVVLFADKEDYANTGKVNGTTSNVASNVATNGTNAPNWGNGMPYVATQATLQRGHDRYQIQCAVCHGATGGGNGIATKYGLVGVASFHQQRLRDMNDGEIYNTIVNGKNSMLGYGASIQLPDRWAIVAYIRALQLSQNATINDVPSDQQAALLGTNAATPAIPVKP